MEIIKEVSTKVMASNDVEIKEGNTVCYSSKSEMCMVGIFVGLTKRGALRIKSPIEDREITAMPSNIEKIFVLESFGVKED